MKTALVAATIGFVFAPGGAATAAPQTATASISGVVVRADTGEPIAGARMVASLNNQDSDRLLEAESGSELLPFLPRVSSDAQGRFLFTDLRPGTYTVTGQRDGFAPQQYGARAPRRPGARIRIVAGPPAPAIVIALVPTGAISGRVTDHAGQPIARMPVVIERVAYTADGQRVRQAVQTSHTNDRGEYRAYWITPGRYYAVASPLRSDVPELKGGGYLATYYPGVTEPSLATAIDVAPASEVNAIDVSLSRQPAFRVRGNVPDTGDFTPDLVWLCATRPAEGADHEGTVWNFAPFHPGKGNGSFEFRNVRSGSYSIHAFAGEVPLLKGTVDVSVADVDHVVLTSDRGATIDLRVRWEGGLTSAEQRKEVPLRLDPLDRCSGDQRTPIRGADGSLRFTGVVDGDYVLRATVPGGAYLKSVRLNGVDAMNGFSVSSAATLSLDVVFSEKAARIEGTVLDKAGRSVPGVEAVLLPIREADRTPGRVAAVVTDQYGRFELQSIPPGEYRLFAWEDMEPYAYFDVDFVRRHMNAATVIRVTENSRQSVQIVSIPPR